jgi:hypothetical protein
LIRLENRFFSPDQPENPFFVTVITRRCALEALHFSGTGAVRLRLHAPQESS